MVDHLSEIQRSAAILSENPELFDNWAELFGSYLFQYGKICQRIDWLLLPDNKRFVVKPRDSTQTIMETVIWSWNDDKIILENVDDSFGRMQISISKDNDNIYKIEDGQDEWTFTFNDNIVHIIRPFSGFLNIHRTKLIFFMLKWLTNMLNFGN